MPSRIVRRASWLAALLLVALAAPAARPDNLDPTQPLGPHLKELQHRLLMERAHARAGFEADAELRARFDDRLRATPPRLRRAHARPARPALARPSAPRPRGTALKPARPGVDATPSGAAAVRGGRTALPARVQAFVPNVRVNNPALDGPVGPTAPKVGQAEEMVGVYGNDILIAYNDGQGFVSGDNQTQGYSFSTDGGKSFKDAGTPPALSGWHWVSDPVVTVNEKTGDFWFCALVEPGTGLNGVGMAHGRFVADTFVWDPPRVIRQVSNSQLLFVDKPWMTVDSLSGNLYVVYSMFSSAADSIEFQSSTDLGATWSNPQILSSSLDAGFVQGARVQVGAAGEVYTTWYAIGQSEPYADYFRFRTSVDHGASFSTERNAASLYANFSSGAPGFNRERGITFPSLAVDRSTGPHRNRLYVAWNEGLDIFHDSISLQRGIREAEPNDVPAQANAFAIGDTIHGEVTASDPFDYYRFTAGQGQTVVFFVGKIDPSLDATLRIFCADGTTRLAFSEPGAGQNNLIQFTIPVTGTYYLRMADASGSGQYTIWSWLHQHQAGDRARDHRDAFVATSDDSGRTWTAPVRVNNEPGWFDDWLPEVVVSGLGKPYVIWYDWHDAPVTACGGQSQVYLARSDDGGASWGTLGAVTDAASVWDPNKSNIAPNQGDYLGFFANDKAIYPSWADARDSSVDVWMVRLPLTATPTQLALATVAADPRSVTLTWYGAGSAGLTATVQRRTSSTDWVALGTVSADGTDQLSYTDLAVVPGARYAYRIGIPDRQGTIWSQEVWVDVPVITQLAIQSVRPNPAARDVWVTYALPAEGAATLELLDVAGRRVVERRIQGRPGAFTLNLAEGSHLPPGIYLVRLTQAGRARTSRVTILQ